MRNLDIADSRARLDQYISLNLIDQRTPLIESSPVGGADAIASRGESPEDEELSLDAAAMEFGTD